MKASLFLLPSLLIVGLSAWMPPAAIAGSETCKNVDIRLTNDTSGEIKVTKLQYANFDQGPQGKYKTETGIFGLDGKQNISDGRSFTIPKRDLEKVNDEQTHFAVTYQRRSSTGGYGLSITQITPNFTCRDGMLKEVVLNKRGN
jgi:hypothetical protein